MNNLSERALPLEAMTFLNALVKDLWWLIFLTLDVNLLNVLQPSLESV